MSINEEKIDQAALALLHLTLHDGRRAWKQIDFDVMHRLQQKGFLLQPTGKAKSVVFTDEGLKASEEWFNKLFKEL